MPRPLPRPWCWLPLLCATLTSLVAAPEPHPTRPGRLVETRGGCTVEYSPGQEPWAEEVFRQLPALLHEIAAAQATPVEPPPLSPADLWRRRGEVLARVAQLTGLDAPSPLQGQTFDTFCAYYEAMGQSMHVLAGRMREMAATRSVQIWHKDEVVRRLAAGESLPGFSYDPADQQVGYEVKFETHDQDRRFAELHAAMDRQRLDHDFSYKLEGGVAEISATVRLGGTPPEAAAPAPDDAPASPAPPAGAPSDAGAGVTWLVALSDKNASAPPAETVGEALASARDFAAQAARWDAYRAGELVSVILHEVAEVGLVERIIGSADRRWLCDGTANYVAWRVVREFSDEVFARTVYDLDGQLRRHASHQPQIRLARWPAVENQPEAERDAPLTRAHYAFATRAMFLLAEKHGPDALAQVWRDVARTPRRKVSAKTFATAYRRQTGEKLAALITEAERLPLPPLPAGTSGTDAAPP